MEEKAIDTIEEIVESTNVIDSRSFWKGFGVGIGVLPVGYIAYRFAVKPLINHFKKKRGIVCENFDDSKFEDEE
jgi:hypothetical protein